MTVEPLKLAEVQQLLGPDQSLVEYFVTNDAVYIWVVERDRMKFEKVEMRRKELVGLVKALRDSIYEVRQQVTFEKASKKLYQELLQKALAHVRGKELIIVPHDVLHYVPFQALISDDGKYLIENYTISYLSSASLLKFTTAKRRAKKGKKVLAMGNPDVGDPRMSLPHAEKEVAGLSKWYAEPTVLLRGEALEGQGKRLSPRHDILHFATHAELREEDPMTSALLLARGEEEDGRLEVREVFGMKLNADLVVLSACETALGKLSRGDELVGLTRAFIYAGTPSVVASLWRVEDSSTAELMAAFHRNLQTMTKAEALRQAQLAMMKGHEPQDQGVNRGRDLTTVAQRKPSRNARRGHPFFWAPFVLVGNRT